VNAEVITGTFSGRSTPRRIHDRTRRGARSCLRDRHRARRSASGQGLTEHTSPFDALILVLARTLGVTIAGARVEATPGTIVRLAALDDFRNWFDSRSGVRRHGFVTIPPSCLGPDTTVPP
jgi:hypothetical protein